MCACGLWFGCVRGLALWAVVVRVRTSNSRALANEQSLGSASRIWVTVEPITALGDRPGIWELATSAEGRATAASWLLGPSKTIIRMVGLLSVRGTP